MYRGSFEWPDSFPNAVGVQGQIQEEGGGAVEFS
jgi:hypothetical protein